MCEIKDAERWEELANLQKNKEEITKARHSFLQAASIYVLQTQIQNKSIFMEKANSMFQQAELVMGKEIPRIMSKQELAKITLQQLHNNHHEEELQHVR